MFSNVLQRDSILKCKFYIFIELIVFMPCVHFPFKRERLNHVNRVLYAALNPPHIVAYVYTYDVKLYIYVTIMYSFIYLSYFLPSKPHCNKRHFRRNCTVDEKARDRWP